MHSLAVISTPNTSAPSVDTRQPHYQALKTRIHQELLNKLNLERLTRTTRDDAEPEIRTSSTACSTKSRRPRRSACTSAKR
jgi:hypothetical protein